MRKKLRQATAHLNHVFFLVFVLLFSVAASSQTVTGKVVDADKKPMSNVSVQVKGTNRATLTDPEGRFSIAASNNDVLVFSYVGYFPQEVQLNGRQAVNVSMQMDTRNMENIVVTALGIRRAERKLGYSAEQVNLSEIQQNRTNNLMASLEGKVAGLNITPPSAGAASSTQIRLRGQSAFAGANNAPLLVVDGLPMDQGAAGANGNASRDGGDNLLLFNPDDIESMTVLKGATAAALYGSRAANGAIIITTKSGTKNTPIAVEFTSNYASDEVLDLTDFQMEFGQGTNGHRPANVGAAIGSGQFGWGERYDGAPTIQYDGETRPYSPHGNRMKEFFRTGKSYNNTIAVSAGNAKTSFRASFSNFSTKGITPRNNYYRKIVNLGVNSNVTDRLSVQINMNYTNSDNYNPPQVGIQGQGYMNFIVRTSPVVPLSVFEEHSVNPVNGAELQTNGFATTILNPYFYIPRQFDTRRNDQVLGTISARYQFFDWLYLQGRVNMNYNASADESNNPTGGLGAGGYAQIYYDKTQSSYNGAYNVSQGNFRDMNYDFILGGDKAFGDYSVDFGFSGNMRTTVGRNVFANSTGFVTRDLYTIANGTVFGQGSGYSKSQVNSLFGWAEFGYKNLLFLNVTGRNDWFSVLNPKSNNYFYPSVSGSFVFSELAKPSWLNFGKLRASYADVGSASGVPIYYGNLTYGYNNNQYLAHTIANIQQGDAPNPNLKPFSVKEKEVGLELKMFGSRVNMDLAVYDKKTTDQIMSQQISTASGYNTTLVNVGSLQNRGVEIVLDLVPVRGRNFTWNSSFNTAYNKSKVLSMGEGVERFIVVDWYNGGASNEFMGKLAYQVGEELNQIVAKTYKRNEKGQILLNDAGRLRPSDEEVLFGSSLPKFTGGWNNNFQYKNLSLLVHIDYKAGGKMLSGSNLNSLRQGHSKASLVGRRPGENGVVFPGIYESGPDAGQPNTTAVFGQAFYADYRTFQIADPFIYKSDYIKLRNVTLSYDFTSLISSRVKFVKGLMLSASCRNAAIIKKYVDDLDPEAVASSGDFRAGYEAVSLPTTRTWGLNLNVKF